MTETFYATQQVRVLTGQGWPPAGIECCASPGATPAAKRTQRACRPRDGASKSANAESTSLTRRKTSSPAL